MFSTTILSCLAFTRTTPPVVQRPALSTVARVTTVLAQDTGKFVRHSELSPGCAPLGVLCAGFDGEQLEMIAGVCFRPAVQVAGITSPVSCRSSTILQVDRLLLPCRRCDRDHVLNGR